MEKPLCKKCPVVRQNKNIIYCGCKKELQARIGHNEELKNMNRKCPLDWSSDTQNSHEKP